MVQRNEAIHREARAAIPGRPTEVAAGAPLSPGLQGRAVLEEPTAFATVNEVAGERSGRREDTVELVRVQRERERERDMPMVSRLAEALAGANR